MWYCPMWLHHNKERAQPFQGSNFLGWCHSKWIVIGFERQIGPSVYRKKSGFAKIVSVLVLTKRNAVNERWWTQLNYAYLNSFRINFSNPLWYKEFFSLEPEILFMTSTETILWSLFSEYHHSRCQFKTIWSKRLERGIINIHTQKSICAICLPADLRPK